MTIALCVAIDVAVIDAATGRASIAVESRHANVLITTVTPAPIALRNELIPQLRFRLLPSSR
jgi:hypothetical protein